MRSRVSNGRASQVGPRQARVPRTPPDLEWEARRHDNEVRYWAAHLDEFVSFLPGIRRHRGDGAANRLVGGVIGSIQGTEGRDAAVLARDRLRDRWRDRREAVLAHARRKAWQGAWWQR